MEAGVFDERAVAQLWKKCISRGPAGQFSNTDNMALVGVLSTQLLHDQFVRGNPERERSIKLNVDVDRRTATAVVGNS